MFVCEFVLVGFAYMFVSLVSNSVPNFGLFLHFPCGISVLR